MLYSFDQQRLQHPVHPSTGEMTDEQLMESMKHGDEPALEVLHRRHHALLRTIISRVISNDFDVEEVLQECLLEVWRRAATYDSAKGQALGWLVTMARRRAIDRIRRKSAYWRAQDRFRMECETVVGTAMHCGADEQAAQDDAAEVVGRLIANLPEAQKQAVQLTYFGGMSQRQIAAHTGIPLGTIKTRLELAMRKLRSAAIAFGEFREALPVAG